MATPYDSVVEFENTIAEYAGAKYGIAVDCCSHAIFLSALHNRIVNSIKNTNVHFLNKKTILDNSGRIEELYA